MEVYFGSLFKELQYIFHQVTLLVFFIDDIYMYEYNILYGHLAHGNSEHWDFYFKPVLLCFVFMTFMSKD